MATPGGYAVNPGLYRIPDLLTEQQLIDYMWNTYGRKIEFVDDVEVNPARALGQTHPVGPLDEVDSGKMSPNAVNDPTLRQLNNMSFGPNYASTPKEEQENENSPVDSVQDEPGLDTDPQVSLDPNEEPVGVTPTGQVQDAPPIPETQSDEEYLEEYHEDYPNK